MNLPHIHVEEMFDQLVREHGGAIVLREHISKSPDYANADYVFHSERVVAELKSLMEDNTESANTQAKLNAVIGRYHAEGKIKTTEVSEDSWRDLPVELQNEIYNITTTSIKGQTKKANRQIRETKERLGLTSYAGMMIIANDGLVSIPPAAFIHAIARYLANNCSEIDLFVFLTANIFAIVKGEQLPTVFWFPMSMAKPARISDVFVNELRLSWQRRVCRKMGVVPVDHQMRNEDMEAFWKARNLPNDAR